MQPEHWRQIDQLFHLALDKARDERALFLAEVCAGDEVLRNDIEELISSHEQADEFIETPASDLAAELLAKGRSGLKLEKIGPYEIQSVPGIGGMGEAYLATDTRLSRRVAIKLLPPQFTLDSARATFAQAAAIIDTIAAGVNDKRLRSKFLNSEAVREVLEGVGR